MPSGSDDKVIIELDLDSSKFEDGLSKSKKGLDESGESGKKAGESITAGFLKAEIIMKGFELAVEGVRKGFEMLSEAIKISGDKQQAVHQLNQAMANAGQYSKEASDSLLEYAEHIEKVSAISSDAVIHTASLARNYAITNEETQKLTKAAVELSAATGVSMDTAVQKLGLSLEGMGGALQKLIPGVDKLSEAELRHGAAIDYVLNRYSGSAESTMQTFNGRMQNLKNSFDQILEKIGDMITNSPKLNGIIEFMGKAFQEASEAIDKFSKNKGFDAVVDNLIAFGQSVINWIIRPLEYGYNVTKLLFHSMVLGVNTVIAAFVELSKAMTDFLVLPTLNSLKIIGDAVGLFSKDMGDKIKNGLAGIHEGVKTVMDNANATVQENSKEMINAVNDDLSNLGKTSLADNLNARMSELESFANKAKVTVGAVVNKTGVDLQRSATAIDRIFQQGIAKTISAGLQSVGAALVKGSSAFADFGKQILGILGDTSIQIGENLILQGTGINALKASLLSMNGASAIAAGAALIVLGGALKAIAGGGGGGASDASASSSPSTGGEIGSPAQASPGQMDKKSAAIIIQGDFLNSRETGNHLAEILRQNSDITDYTITAQGKSYG